MAVWPNSILPWRHMKTHLEFSKKHLKDPQTVRNNIIWSWTSNIMFEGNQLCLSPADAPFSAAGTEGLVRAEEKVNAPKYRDSLNENPVQSIQNLRLGRRFTFQWDSDPKHTARVAYGLLCECPWEPSHSLGLNAIKYFCKNLKMCIFPHPTWKRCRGEEKNGRYLPNADV